MTTSFLTRFLLGVTLLFSPVVMAMDIDEPQPSPKSLAGMPGEVVHVLATFLPLSDVGRLAQVNHGFSQLMDDYKKRLIMRMVSTGANGGHMSLMTGLPQELVDLYHQQVLLRARGSGYIPALGSEGYDMLVHHEGVWGVTIGEMMDAGWDQISFPTLTIGSHAHDIAIEHLKTQKIYCAGDADVRMTLGRLQKIVRNFNYVDVNDLVPANFCDYLQSIYEPGQPLHLLVSQQELAEHGSLLTKIFKHFPDTILVLDLHADDQGCVTLYSFNLEHVRFIDLINTSKDIVRIGSRFLNDNRYLKALSLSSLTNISIIEDRFVSGCRWLTHIDLSSLVNTTEIGSFFLCRSWGLTSLNLSALANVRTIGLGFLNHCIGLVALDLSSLTKLTHIEDAFLNLCKSLTALDLSPLGNVKTIEDLFLSQCTGLKIVSFVGLDDLAEFGHIEDIRQITTSDTIRTFTNVQAVYVSQDWDDSYPLMKELLRFEEFRNKLVRVDPLTFNFSDALEEFELSEVEASSSDMIVEADEPESEPDENPTQEVERSVSMPTGYMEVGDVEPLLTKVVYRLI